MCDNTIISNPVNITVNMEGDIFAPTLAGDGSALNNLNASNLAFGHVNSSLIYGNTLSNINASNIVGSIPSTVLGNTVSNLNASNLAFGHVNSSLIYGNTLSNINASNITGLVVTSGNTLSNINASNLTFGIVNNSLIYGNTLSNINASNINGLMTVSGNTMGNLNASNLTFGIVNSTLIYGNQISNINSSNITQPFSTANVGTLNVSGATTMSALTVGGPIISTNTSNFANLFVSNLTVTGNFIVTATNTTVTNSLSVVNQGTTTALYVNQNEFPNMNYNVAEFWDHTQLAMVIDGYGNVAVHTTSSPGYAFTVVQGASIDTLNVSGISNLNSVAATTANVGTLNVLAISNLNSLTTNLSATTANVGILNVLAISNLNSLALTNNLYTANSVTTTNLFTAGITSNASNTVFNYSTLTVPFINSTTLNVASTSNIGATYMTSSNVSGISNLGQVAITGTLQGSTLSLTGTTGTTSLVATTVGTGANVFIFSNTASTPNNTVAMDSNGVVLIGLSPSSNANYVSGYSRISKAKMYINSNTASSASYPINLVLASKPGNSDNSYYNGIDFGGGGQGCVQIVQTSIGGGNGALSFFFNNSNGADGNNILEGHRMSRTAMSINSTAALVATGLNFQVTGNAYISNTFLTNNVFATGNVVIGPPATSILANLHVEQGSLFIGNSAAVGTTVNTNSITQGTLVFDNTANVSIIPNKIVLYNNTAAANQYCGFGVQHNNPPSPSLLYYARSAHIWYTNGTTQQMVMLSSGANGMGTTVPTAKLHVNGFSSQSNITVRVDSSNVAIATTGGGLVGINTLTPSANVHVLGNIYSTTDLVTANSVQTANVYAATVNTTNPISFRNRVINGDFLIDQRNSGAATTPTIDGKPVIDRWKINIVGLGRCQVGQGLGGILAPAGFASYFGMKVTTSNAVSTGDYFFASQVIEGVNAIDWFFGQPAAKTVTLSFWVYTSITGTMGGFIRNAGTSAGNYTRSYPFTFTVNLINTWEYKTITIAGDTSGTWYRTQTDGIEFGIELWNGATYQSAPGAWAAGNFTGPTGGTINCAGPLNSYVYLTGVQFESGTVATPFERRLYDFELAACQRYYETSIARVGGYNTNGAYLRGSVYMNTKKRPAASPTFTVISTLETSNCGSMNFDNSNFDGSSARYLVPLTSTGDAFGQWKVSVDCEF